MLLRREHLPQMLGAAAFAALFSAASVHPQATPESAGSGSAATGNAAPSTGAPASGSSGATGQTGAGGTPATGSSPSATAAPEKSTTGTQSASAGKLSKTDVSMMREIARANAAEIEAGKLAQSKSKNEKVVAFGKQMEEDHSKAQSELEQLAQAKGVSLPTEPDAKHKAALKKMSALSDEAFDRAYIKQGGLSDHKQAHNLLQRVKTKAKDPDLRAAADKMLPTVDQHLKMAQQLPAEKASTASGASQAPGSSAAGSSAAPAKPDKGKSDTSGSSGSSGK